MKSLQKKMFYGATLCLLLLMTVSCSSTKTMVVMLPEDNNPRGSVAVGEGDRSVVLDSPMTKAEVNAQGHIEKGTISKDEVDKTFSEALAAQPPEQISFILYFEEGTSVLLEQSKDTLSRLFEEVAKRQAVEVQVTGHTDTLGSEIANDRLSAERAQTIRDMLIKRGLQASFVRAVGRGERELLIETSDNVREPMNRRVEVIVR